MTVLSQLKLFCMNSNTCWERALLQWSLQHNNNFSSKARRVLKDHPIISSDDPLPNAKLKLSPKTQSQSKEILEYFQSHDAVALMKLLPQKILKRKRSTPESLYIVEKDVAKRFVDKIKPLILRGGQPVLELNPGLGLMSKELLNAGVSTLRLYEPDSTFHPHLNVLRSKYVERVDIKHNDLLLLYKQAYQDKFDNGSRVENMLSGITRKPWSDDPAMKIVGALTTVNFVKHLISSFIFQNGIMTVGRPELYLAMPPPLYIHLTCDSRAGYLQYRSTTVLFQLMFTTKLLDKLPRKAFLPWEAEYTVNKKSKLAKVRCVDPEYLYLVKIEPRVDFFESVATVDKLQPLGYFIQQNLISRKNRVIPQLEKWVPGCGPRLIVGGLNIFTQFGDLSPREVLSVFNEFASWPEYPHCPFLPSMESSFLKMESAGIDKELDAGDPDEGEEEEEEADHHCVPSMESSFRKMESAGIDKEPDAGDPDEGEEEKEHHCVPFTESSFRKIKSAGIDKELDAGDPDEGKEEGEHHCVPSTESSFRKMESAGIGEELDAGDPDEREEEDKHHCVVVVPAWGPEPDDKCYKWSDMILFCIDICSRLVYCNK